VEQDVDVYWPHWGTHWLSNHSHSPLLTQVAVVENLGHEGLQAAVLVSHWQLSSEVQALCDKYLNLHCTWHVDDAS